MEFGGNSLNNSLNKSHGTPKGGKGGGQSFRERNKMRKLGEVAGSALCSCFLLRAPASDTFLLLPV